MNIFYLDEDPVKAAQAQCDKHIVKMVLESAQILSTALVNLGHSGHGLYRPTHKHHPCVKWASESRSNFDWLVNHGIALADEYEFRYGRTHLSLAKIFRARDQRELLLFPSEHFTNVALAMPDSYKDPNDRVKSYRDYYRKEKAKIAKWDRGRPPPKWW